MGFFGRMFGNRSANREFAAPARRDREDAQALMRQATEQFQAGNWDEARDVLERVLAFDPEQAEALYLLAGIKVGRGEAETGVELIRKALAIAPGNPNYHFSLGEVLTRLGRFDEAIPHLREAVERRPDAIGWKQQLDAALHNATLASGHDPGAAQFNIGLAFEQRGQLREAEQAFYNATLLDRDATGPHIKLALVRRDQGRPVEAEAPALQATQIDPLSPDAWWALGSVLSSQGNHNSALECFRRTIELRPDHEAAWCSLLFSLNYSDAVNAQEVFDEHIRYGRLLSAEVAEVPPRRNSSAKVKVGYLSADFVQHPIAHFIRAPLEHHDRSRFEVYCYFAGNRSDGVTESLRAAADHWRAVANLGGEELFQLLRDDGIDILVDLSGHSSGNRLAVLARKPAPVQVTYLGYPNTTGLVAIDFRLTDAYADPPGRSDQLHAERLVRLPRSFLCYSPAPSGVEIALAREQPGRQPTFASFNNVQKISPTCVRLWARLLDAVPESRLLLKSPGLGDPGLRARLKESFERQGIESTRVETAAWTADRRQHLDTYAEADVGLDTFPYHGTTTTFDALYMGVPVVTLEGERHASRVGVSILSNLGLPDLLVARNEDEYIAKAVALIRQPTLLAELRTTLRSRLLNAPNCDAAAFTRDLERAYLDMLKVKAQ
jgi:protein O-GlcNAc transferase